MRLNSSAEYMTELAVVRCAISVEPFFFSSSATRCSVRTTYADRIRVAHKEGRRVRVRAR